jgi:hypothetical protein
MMQTHGELEGHIHYWRAIPHNNWLISFEDEKRLLSFETVNDMVTYLYLEGYKEQARELNRRQANA